MDRSQSDDSAEAVEVFEHVPWAQLTSPHPERKPWVVYVVAGAMAAAALGALVARSVDRTEVPVSVTSPPTTAQPITEVPPTLPVPDKQFSEADLLAIAPGEGELAAAARAEWFVVDYFSTGGNPAADEGVREALPDVARLPLLSGQGASYVEWVATSRIEALGHGQYRSTVLFRMLVAGSEGSYRRLPVQAVDVVVAVDEAGQTRVADLPMPAQIGEGPPADGWADPSESLPEAVRRAALRTAESWGSTPTMIEGSEKGTGWRIVVEAGDAAGVRWPLTVWLTDLGEPLLGP